MVVIATLKETFRLSLAKRLWLYCFILMIVAYVGAALVQALTIGAVFNLLLGSFTDLSLAAQFSKLIQAVIAALPLLVFAYVVYLVLYILFEAVVAGLFLNGMRLFVSQGIRGIEMLVSSSWSATRPRIKTAFLTTLLLNVVVIVLVTIMFLPLLLAMVSELPNLASFSYSDIEELSYSGGIASVSSKILAAAIPTILMLLVFFVAWILLIPMLVLISPVVYFENLGVIGSIKRAFSLGKRNYLRNFAFLILLWLGAIVPAIILVLLLFVSMINPLLLILLIIPWIIVFFIYILWIITFLYLGSVKYYFMVTEGERTSFSSSSGSSRKWASNY